jgi:hypothetical protein
MPKRSRCSALTVDGLFLNRTAKNQRLSQDINFFWLVSLSSPLRSIDDMVFYSILLALATRLSISDLLTSTSRSLLINVIM